MLIDQAEIDALLAQADQLVGEATELAGRPSGPDGGDAGGGDSGSAGQGAPAELARLLRIRVPVIVLLAARRMSLASVRTLSCGAIIEFEKFAEEPLDLLVNNRRIGCGEAVKVGENFGLRVLQIDTPAKRIRSMGR